ncbi:MAG: hypothetical protein ACREOD_07170 [Candidatus Dormibacteria bacterium]
MSLGVVFKAPDGVVLAADSRATLFKPLPPVPTGERLILAATFDNATKLLQFEKQSHLGAVTFGAAVIGKVHARSAQSFLPQFEASLPEDPMTVEQFAKQLAAFYGEQWRDAGMPDPAPEPMVFGVAGYDPGSLVGSIFEVSIPLAPAPRRILADDAYGAWWGGQRGYVDRLLNGFDQDGLKVLLDYFNVPAAKRDPGALNDHLKERLGAPVPWQFLSLQDCVSFSAFLIRTTIGMQSWTVDVRGVGGAVDVATITPTRGFKAVKVKEIVLEQAISG